MARIGTAEDGLVVLVQQHSWSMHLGLATHGRRHVHCATSRTRTLPRLLAPYVEPPAVATHLEHRGQQGGQQGGGAPRQALQLPPLQPALLLGKEVRGGRLGRLLALLGWSGGQHKCGNDASLLGLRLCVHMYLAPWQAIRFLHPAAVPARTSQPPQRTLARQSAGAAPPAAARCRNT